MEYESKIKNYKFIEERNQMLEKENQQLKNKIDKYIGGFPHLIMALFKNKKKFLFFKYNINLFSLKNS